ncbi:sensor histidine kinase [Pelistega sp. NLN82]|uniref:histidine kinase n=1 Tax=Pelistega ratti TaxID=2652177 RepID=A0A6L9Y6Q1_9BURK|nr:sensor histidine kinase [Pelistega ratti]NEN76150.1 sensor histidine kinase [Pelistega ratti]
MKQHYTSLKSTLLWLLIPIFIAITIVFLLVSTQELKTQINQAFDRTLAGALRSIEVNIHTNHGGLSMEQPFYLFEFLALTTQSPVYFRVATEDGLTELGYAAIPLPEQALQDKPIFYNSTYFGEPIRVAAIAIYPKNTLHYAPDTKLIIQVAELSSARQDFIKKMLWQTLIKDIVILIILAIIIWVGILMALKPLKKLSHKINARHENDLSPILADHIPQEIQPLVNALNLHMERYTQKSQRQRQFLDDASHQLRTPLAVLNTQISYAQSLISQEHELNDVLTAMQKKISTTINLTNQLLTLAKVQDLADNHTTYFTHEVFDLTLLTRHTVNELLPLARQKRIDYGLDIPDTPIYITGIPWLIKEALSNLIHNAIQYTPQEGHITIAIRTTLNTVELCVEDNGIGMSTQEIEEAGKRFQRGQAAQTQQGSGLGLAIVKTIAEINHATLTFVSRPTYQGLKVSLHFPISC